MHDITMAWTAVASGWALTVICLVIILAFENGKLKGELATRKRRKKNGQIHNING